MQSFLQSNSRKQFRSIFGTNFSINYFHCSSNLIYEIYHKVPVALGGSYAVAREPLRNV